MENTIDIHIKKLSSGSYLATSNDFGELFAHGKTIYEALEAAKLNLKKFILQNK